MKQQQQRKQTQRKKTIEEQDVELTSSPKDVSRLKEELDDILEDIDAVLEENAEEFVKNYVQQGGQ